MREKSTSHEGHQASSKTPQRKTPKRKGSRVHIWQNGTLSNFTKKFLCPKLEPGCYLDLMKPYKQG